MYAFFLFASGLVSLVGGIYVLRRGLDSALGGRVRRYFSSAQITPWKGFFIGAAAAALMQSSTAVSLIAIGLVGAGFIAFTESLGIILGANVGTCTTVQLIAIQPSGAFIVYVLLGLSALMLFFQKLRRLSAAALGIGAIFSGLTLLAGAMQQTGDARAWAAWLLQTEFPIISAVLFGALVTAVLQSSSAATALLMTMGAASAIDLTTAAYIVYGNNIGSCLSSLVVGAASPLEAKRTAASHFILNLIGAILFLPFTGIFASAVSMFTGSFEARVALMHTAFNLISSLAVMPFIRQYAKCIEWLLPRRT